MSSCCLPFACLQGISCITRCREDALAACLQANKDEEQCYTELRDLMSRSAGFTLPGALLCLQIVVVTLQSLQQSAFSVPAGTGQTSCRPLRHLPQQMTARPARQLAKLLLQSRRHW